MTWETYLLYLATVAVFFATPPGPSQILILSNGARLGVRRSLATVAGDLSANALQMLAAGFGLATLIASSAGALTAIKWLGVAYLVFVGVRMFLAAPAEAGQPANQESVRRLYLQGFVTSGANPKAVFFFAALFPQFLDPAAPLWPQLVVLGVTYLVIDGTILVAYAAGARKVLGRLEQRGRLLNRLSGAMMIAAAGLLGLRDVHAR